MKPKQHCLSLVRSLETAESPRSFSSEPLQCDYIYGRGLGQCALRVSVVDGQVVKTDANEEVFKDPCEGAIDVTMAYLSTSLTDLEEGGSQQ